MTRINLLPWRAALREERKRAFLTLLAGCAFITVLLVILINVTNSTRVSYQQKRNDYLQEHLKVLDNQIKELKGLQKQKDQLLARMTIIQQLQANRPIVVHVFDDLVRLIPEGLYLTRIQLVGNMMTLQGKTQTNTRVSTFMRNIEGSKWLSQPVLLEIKDATAGATAFDGDFTMQVFINTTTPALPTDDSKEKAKAKNGN